MEQNTQNDFNNGSFLKKPGFTMASNTAIRDKTLSLKAKGLYTLIRSYVTLQDFTLTKEFLVQHCKEGSKAFEAAWSELKENGYLKVHMKPSPAHGHWLVQYELLDTAQLADGVHTYYYNLTGQRTGTNITLKEKRERQREVLADEQPDNDLTPQNVGDGQRYPHFGYNAEGSSAEGTYANGGDKVISSRKTPSKTSSNTPSISQYVINEHESSDGLSDEELQDVVEEEIEENKVIPYNYKSDKKKMQYALKYFTSYDTLVNAADKSDSEKHARKLLLECLVEMACADTPQTYSGSLVSYSMVIDRLNECIQNDNWLEHYVDETIDDYIKAGRQKEIKNNKNYLKSVIWNSFFTYAVKSDAEIARNNQPLI